jgi:hypothetical protein
MKMIGAALVGGMLLGTALIAVRPQAQETESEEPADVTEAEVELYIDVYAAMQEDHALMIEQVLATRQVTLEQFRSIERRVQQQQRLVDRVREALLEKAKSRTAFLSPPAAAPPTPGAGSGPTPGR